MMLAPGPRLKSGHRTESLPAGPQLWSGRTPPAHLLSPRFSERRPKVEVEDGGRNKTGPLGSFSNLPPATDPLPRGDQRRGGGSSYPPRPATQLMALHGARRPGHKDPFVQWPCTPTPPTWERAAEMLRRLDALNLPGAGMGGKAPVIPSPPHFHLRTKLAACPVLPHKVGEYCLFWKI